MPNYEPTPRRFSVLSVSRSASRRNSVDESVRPSLVQDPSGHQRESPPLDLTTALRHLQHVDPDSEMERGRKRQAGGDKAAWTTWGHDGMVTAPAARRETSSSTRERIAVWEERSRSQSKGRSKSRGRNLGSRNRISVVPEIPELTAAFAQFAEEEMQENLDDQKTQVASPSSDIHHLPGDNFEHIIQSEKRTRDVIDREPEVAAPAGDAEKRQEMIANSLHGTKQVDKPFPNISSNATTPTETKELGFERPQTPVWQTGHRPITPETTPSMRPPGADSSEPQGLDLLLTPQATPDHGRHRWQGKDEHMLHSLRGQPHVESNSVEGYTAMFQPKTNGNDPIEDGELTTQPQEQYHLPNGLLSEEPPRQQRQLNPEPAISPQTKASGKTQTHSSPKLHEGPRYHNVWRISSYQPEFPLPDRRLDYANVEAVGNTGFIGNPLQELPPGQLSAEPRNHQAVDSSAYPYARPRDSGGGDWVVNIPPSPSRAYFPGEQPAPRARHGNQARERYTSRADASRHEWDAPPVIERALHAASVSMIQGLNVPVEVYRGLRDTYYPAPGRPDIIKAYPVRRRLPVRCATAVFLPTLTY